MRRVTSRFMAVVCTMISLWCSPPLFAAEPVEVVVSGVEDEALDNVQTALALPFGLVRDGTVDRLWLERFQRQAADRARLALEPFGYYHARVVTALETLGSDTYRLNVLIDPGPPVMVTESDVTFTGPGAGEERLRELREAFPVRRGEPLNQQAYEKAKGALVSRAQELGYLDASYPVHAIRIDRERLRAVVTLVFATGPRYRFDGTTIRGGEGYPEEVLRRYLAYKPGEPFSQAKLGETQLNYANSERFKQVTVVPRKQEAENLAIPVTVELTPAPPRLLRPGVGYGTDTGARFTLRYRDLNIFHLGHQFQSHIFVSERLQGGATEYTIPSPRDIKTSTSFQLNLQKEDVSTYQSSFVAFEADRNRSFRRGQLGTAYLRLQVEDFTVGSENSSSRLILPGLRFSQTRYDDLVRPTRGHRFLVDVRGTHQYLGSSTGLLQIITEGTRLFPLPWRLSLSLRGRAGLTMQNDPFAELPASLRFFAGGDHSVRGYAYQSLGPKNARGVVVGGNNLLTGSIELERHLFADWGVSAFYDAGNAFNSLANIRLYEGAGVGAHYYTRIGALNVYVARQIGISDPGYRVHVTVGFEL